MASTPKQISSFFIFLLSLSLLTITTISSSPTHTHNKPSSKSIAFIQTSCRTTRYPTLCYHSLSPYATQIHQNQRKLVTISLAVSLARARSTALYVSRLRKSAKNRREYMAVKDCVDTMGDSVNEISKSIWELSHMGRANQQEFSWHMSNVETWVSAALTDEGTCFDGFSGNGMEGHVKDGIRNRINNVAQVTSNALALVNQYAHRHY